MDIIEVDSGVDSSGDEDAESDLPVDSDANEGSGGGEVSPSRKGQQGRRTARCVCFCFLLSAFFRRDFFSSSVVQCRRARAFVFFGECRWFCVVFWENIAPFRACSALLSLVVSR